MKFTWTWLLDHLETDKNLSEILETLPKLGLEVASVVNLAEDLKSFISVEIIDVKKHPNADRLKITTVDIGEDEPLQIVCGAPNVDKNQTVAVAMVGTVLYPNNEKVKIKKSKIRGEMSGNLAL